MKLSRLPIQEESPKTGGSFHIAVDIPSVDKNNSHLIKFIFSRYLGERCKYCGRLYETLSDLEDTVWAGRHERGRLACRSCWSVNNPAGVPITVNTLWK